MIEVYQGKDKNRAIIGITPENNNLTVSMLENGIGVIEGTKEEFEGLYEALKDTFDFQEGEEGEE